MTPTGTGLPEPEGTGATGGWPFGLEARAVERPHVVITLDTRTGAASFSGPYRTAIGALCAADVEYQVDLDQGGKGELTFHVAALHAPIGIDDADPPLPTMTAPAPARRDLPDLRHVVRALVLFSTVAERLIRRRPHLAVGAVAVTAAACLPNVGDGWARRARSPRLRHLLGHEAR